MKNILITAVVGLVIGGLIGFFLGSPHGGVASAYPTPSGPTSNFSWIVASVSVDSPYFRFADTSGNVQASMAADNVALVTATDTPCAVQNAVNATSTVLVLTINPSVAWPGNAVLQVGTSSSPNGTSTIPFASFIVPAGRTTPVTWDGASTSTNPTTDTNPVLGPNDWLTVGVVGSSSMSIAGSCTGTFISI